VGLAQREIEAAGIPTVSLSMIPDFTCATGAPRVAAVAYPTSRPLGEPGDAEGQRRVLLAALTVLEAAEEPGTVVTLPFDWPEPAKSVRRQRLDEPPPIARLIQSKPWLYFKLVAGEIPATADDLCP
jgi:hypothetical protein